jgi:GNAT superfamily N-acetyltransferase
MLCIGCQNSKVSKAQLEIYEFINSRVPARLADRDVIGPLELDVYVPSKRFAIEYNGLYYHSEAFGKVDPATHSRKQKLCQDADVSLFQIFEDEWLKKRDIVESMIKHRLDLSDDKIYARNCEVMISGPSRELNEFLESSHLEGVGGRYSVAFSLHHGGELLAVLTLRKPLSKIHAGLIEVARFAVKKNTTIPGGMSRLVTKALQWAKENEFTGLMTYLDQRLGAVMTYESCGFKFVKETPPRFWWASLKEMKRYPRQKFKATSNLTESEVAFKENVYKIYGCKNSFFMLKFT